jgi:hypothetical protein
MYKLGLYGSNRPAMALQSAAYFVMFRECCRQKSSTSSDHGTIVLSGCRAIKKRNWRYWLSICHGVRHSFHHQLFRTANFAWTDVSSNPITFPQI